MTRIRLENLTKSFGEELAVDSFNIEINDGEFLVLVGPSGCGKSTTLRMIAGLEQATAGHIWFDDINVTDFPPKERNVGMVFQSYALYPHMTIEENLSFGLRLKGIDRMTIIEKVKETASLLGIEDHLSKKPKQLSGGQRQRVALGRAIIRSPYCFLFDEPLSNLDAKLRVQMRAEIQRLQSRTGITSIYVTHDQTEAMSMADHIAIMNKGVIQQVGTPDDVYMNPVNKFVASFIGSPEMNIIEGTIIDKDGEYYVRTYLGQIQLSQKRFYLKDNADKPVYVGIRPEHLNLSTGIDALLLEVDVIEPLGSDTFLYGQMDKDTQICVRIEGMGEKSNIKRGEVKLKVNSDNVHLFDFKTELSLRKNNSKIFNSIK